MKTQKIKVCTQGGHRLFLSRVQMYAPGEPTEMELTEDQLACFVADGRILTGDQVDTYQADLAALKAGGKRKPRGTVTNSPKPKPSPDEAPGFFTKAKEKIKKRKSKAAD